MAPPGERSKNGMASRSITSGVRPPIEYGANVSVLSGTGTGSFLDPVDVAADGGTYWVAAGDMNGDGRPDFVAAEAGDKIGVLITFGCQIHLKLTPPGGMFRLANE